MCSFWNMKLKSILIEFVTSRAQCIAQKCLRQQHKLSSDRLSNKTFSLRNCNETTEVVIWSFYCSSRETGGYSCKNIYKEILVDNSTSNVGIKMEAYFKEKNKIPVYMRVTIWWVFPSQIAKYSSSWTRRFDFISSNQQLNQNFTG